MSRSTTLTLLLLGAAAAHADSSVPGEAGAARAGVLRLVFEHGASEGTAHLNVRAHRVSWQGAHAWGVALPPLLDDSFFAGRAELDAYRVAARPAGFGPYLAPLVAADGVVLASHAGAAVFAERDGALLLTAPADSPRPPQPYWDTATVTIRTPRQVCTTHSAHGELLVRCGDRVLHLEGGQASILAPGPWRIVGRSALRHRIARSAALVRLDGTVGDVTIAVDGIAYIY